MKKRQCKSNNFQYNFIVLLLMRIDFSQLEHQEISPNTVNAIFSNPLLDIWKSASLRGQQQSDEVQQESPILTLSVSYPYNINRSVLPSAINKSLTFMEAKKELPVSTIRFIEKQLHEELSKREHEGSQRQTKQANRQGPLQKCIKKSQYSTLAHIENNIMSKETLRLGKRQQLCEGKEAKERKHKQSIKARIQDVLKKEERVKHQKTIQQGNELTLKPLLKDTRNSKIAKQIKKKRTEHFKTCNIDVFESLYNDAAINAAKRSLQKIIIEEQSRVCSHTQSKIKINSTFQQRLRKSIQKKANRKEQASQKLLYDLSTGRKLFVPDTKESKETYNSLFKDRKSRHIFPLQDGKYPARAAHYSKDSEKLDKSQEQTSTIINSQEREINKSLDRTNRNNRHSLSRQRKIASFYTDLIWREQCIRPEILCKQEKRALNKFLLEVQKFSNHNHVTMSKQVFIDIFESFYSVTIKQHRK